MEPPVPSPRIKVCCIASEAEADLAIALGAHAIGLVGAMPSGPGVIDDDLARCIARHAPPGVDTFLLTSRTDADAIAAHVEHVEPTTVQIVRHVPVDIHARLRERLPHTRRVQVIHVEDERAIDLALTYAPYVDALLLDSGRPSASVVELGGTGRTHDWSISRRIARQTECPVWLAGGLGPHNVPEAIRRVRPFGVDLCSSVRRGPGDRLDRSLLAAFVDAVGQAPDDPFAPPRSQ